MLIYQSANHSNARTPADQPAAKIPASAPSDTGAAAALQRCQQIDGPNDNRLKVLTRPEPVETLRRPLLPRPLMKAAPNSGQRTPATVDCTPNQSPIPIQFAATNDPNVNAKLPSTTLSICCQVMKKAERTVQKKA